MRLLPAATREWTPWRNGGGVTSEVAAYPPGSAAGDFDWRVSIARIDQDGPFSSFPGVERSLMPLTGGPLLLDTPTGSVTLEPGAPPYRFYGDAAIHARILAPASDLNVMTRRGRWRHWLGPQHPDNLAAERIWIERASLDAVHLAPGEAGPRMADDFIEICFWPL